MPGANQDAILAVREQAFRDVEWTEQATGLTAVNGAPTAPTDGVSLDSRAAFGFQVVEEAATADYTLTVWGYTDGEWGKIPDGEYTATGGLVDGTNIGGLLDRVYLEISTYNSGTIGLKVGVPKP